MGQQTRPRWHHYASAWPVVGLGWLLAQLPHRVGLALGAGLGRVCYYLMPGRRLVAQTNIGACFPAYDNNQQRALVKAVFAETGMGLVESAISWWRSGARLTGLAQIDGIEHLQKARANGGVIVLFAHYPSLELAGALLNRSLAEPIFGVAREHNNPVLQRAFHAGRLRHCTEVYAKGDALRLMRTLKQGQSVFYAADLNFNQGVVFAPLFGVPASCVTALADIAERSGAAVVPMWCRRNAEGRYQIILEPAWPDYPDRDQVAAATRMNQWIERHLAALPAQYLWLHRRFKNQPAGSPPFYPPRARRAKHR